jgi:predicted transcriptional regulator
LATTTIRIDDALKERIAAADRAGKSSHALILEALAETVERIEMDDALHRSADKRWSHLVRTGESIAWDDARAYLQARAAGRKLARPVPRKA